LVGDDDEGAYFLGDEGVVGLGVSDVVESGETDSLLRVEIRVNTAASRSCVEVRKDVIAVLRLRRWERTVQMYSPPTTQFSPRDLRAAEIAA